MTKLLIIESEFYQRQGMLGEAYRVLQGTDDVKVVGSGRLFQRRAEIHLEVADSDMVDQILQDKNASLGNEIDSVIDLAT